MSLISESLSWDDLQRQAGLSVSFWMGMAEKEGLITAEQQLKFAEIAQREFQATGLLKIADSLRSSLDELSSELMRVVDISLNRED